MRLSAQNIIILLVAFGLHGAVGRTLPQQPDALVPAYSSIHLPRGGVPKTKPKPIGVPEEPKPKPKDPANPDPEPIVRPGQETGDTSGTILTKDQYIARGQTVQKNLASTIATKDNDKAVRPEGTLPAPGDGSVANVKDGYELVDDNGFSAKDGITDTNYVYEDLTGILPERSSFTRMNWHTNVPTDKDSIVNYGGYNKETGTIVVDDVVAANDLLPTGDPRRLKSSDITFQSWQHVAGDKVGELNTVVQKNVQNDGARKMLQDIYQRRGLSIDNGKGDFAMDPNDFDREEDFLSLLGTDNGRPTTYMLKDYHGALGDKKVTQILTYAYKTCENMKGDMIDGPCWHMILKIGK
ncbi:hypothetical protein OCU04_005873 [Sclerotinia nivalis]|uniref:Uncharacterized protein n=1 Tax=Sclerotinia nivalis TaxID=352851 RepID=A0A9X0DJZ3_9HELO|nr:hypothetical protein OCU04_005873 [Sclerotinia nivalis]